MVRPLLLAATAALALCACAPVTSYNGFQAREEKPADVKVGVDTRATVQSRLGSPSTQSVFNGDGVTWYYISQVTDREAYHLPTVRSREVVAVSFDKDNKVTAVKKMDLKDGYQVAYEKRQTPTRGRELSLFEQLLGTIGASSVLPHDDDPGRTARDRH